MYLVSAGGSGLDAFTVHLRSVPDGRLLKALQGHTDVVKAAAFTPDGNFVLTGGFDRTLRFWRVSDGSLARFYDVGYTYDIAFAPDGRHFAYARGYSTAVARNPFFCDSCDVNCDGSVNQFDIQPFIDGLGDDPPPPCSSCAADANGDGSVNSFDVEPFIDCIRRG